VPRIVVGEGDRGPREERWGGSVVGEEVPRENERRARGQWGRERKRRGQGVVERVWEGEEPHARLV